MRKATISHPSQQDNTEHLELTYEKQNKKMIVLFAGNSVPHLRELPFFYKFLTLFLERELGQNRHHLSCLDAYSEAFPNQCITRKTVIND